MILPYYLSVPAASVPGLQVDTIVIPFNVRITRIIIRQGGTPNHAITDYPLTTQIQDNTVADKVWATNHLYLMDIAGSIQIHNLHATEALDYHIWGYYDV